MWSGTELWNFGGKLGMSNMADATIPTESFEIKRCSVCDESKPLSAYGLLYGKPRARCRACQADDARKWRKANPQKAREQKRRAHARDPQKKVAAVRAWRLANPEKYKAQGRRAYEKDPEGFVTRVTAWREANPARARKAEQARRRRRKAHYAALTREYQATKQRATPTWADRAAMCSIYEDAARLTAATGIPHEVDHIVPLTSGVVSGLHWEGNLRVVTRTVNRSKHNRLIEGLFHSIP